MTTATRSRLGRFSRYAIVGVASNGTLYLAFLLLIWLTVPPLVASGICYVVGVLASYFLNRTWSFASTSTHLKDASRFIAAYGFGLVVTLISMYLLVDPLGPALAQFLTIGITAVGIYAALELLRFGR